VNCVGCKGYEKRKLERFFFPHASPHHKDAFLSQIKEGVLLSGAALMQKKKRKKRRD
jgi:hypothetical protein